jgi:glutamyl-tRNA synthetase
VEKFNFESLGKPDGKFDAKKFADVAFEHLKRNELTAVESYADQVMPFLQKRGFEAVDRAKLLAAIPTIRERARTLVDAAESLDFYFRKEPVFDAAACKKFLTAEASEILQALAETLSSVDEFVHANIETAVQDFLTAKGLQMKVLAQPARVALTGKSVSPGLFEVLEVLGRDDSLTRLKRGVAIAKGELPCPEPVK